MITVPCSCSQSKKDKEKTRRGLSGLRNAWATCMKSLALYTGASSVAGKETPLFQGVDTVTAGAQLGEGFWEEDLNLYSKLN